MLIDIPTLFVVIIAMSFTLFLAIGWVAKPEDRDGLRPLIHALALHGAAYALFALRGSIPDFWSVWVANIAIVCAYSLFTFAVTQFQRRAVSLLVLLGPIAVVAVLFGLFMSNLTARIVVGSMVLLYQDVLLLRLLLSGRKQTAGRGQYLIIAGVGINLLVMMSRAIVAYGNVGFISSITDASLSQTLVYFSAFISLTLVAIGFVLMTKESSDEKTRLMAMKDKLTDCWNRFRIEETAHHEMMRMQRYGTPVSLILIDIDFFKQINDQYGHATGDAVLRGFAATAQSCIRNTDVLGRWGGEEFVVLLPASGASAAAGIAERIRRAVEQSEYVEGVKITASFGFSSCQSTDTWDSWVHRADVVLYRAKSHGRNRVESEVLLQPGGNDPLTGEPLLRIVWREAYETGCKKIDTQHRLLFDYGNQLFDLMLRAVPRDDLEMKIMQFINFMKIHMQTEEEMLQRVGVTGLEEHRELHRGLLDRANLLLERYVSDQLEAGDLLHFIVYELTAQHVLIDDRGFEPLLRGLE